MWPRKNAWRGSCMATSSSFAQWAAFAAISPISGTIRNHSSSGITIGPFQEAFNSHFAETGLGPEGAPRAPRVCARARQLVRGGRAFLPAPGGGRSRRDPARRRRARREAARRARARQAALRLPHDDRGGLRGIAAGRVAREPPGKRDARALRGARAGEAPAGRRRRLRPGQPALPGSDRGLGRNDRVSRCPPDGRRLSGQGPRHTRPARARGPDAHTRLPPDGAAGAAPGDRRLPLGARASHDRGAGPGHLRGAAGHRDRRRRLRAPGRRGGGRKPDVPERHRHLHEPRRPAHPGARRARRGPRGCAARDREPHGAAAAVPDAHVPEPDGGPDAGAVAAGGRAAGPGAGGAARRRPHPVGPFAVRVRRRRRWRSSSRRRRS